MKLEFLGVGEAMDPELGNSSVLVSTKIQLLVDCGFAVPREYFAKQLDPNFLDAVYLTHCHSDHTFGIPTLLTRLNEEGRTKPLTFIGQVGTQQLVQNILDMGIPGIRTTYGYELQFIDTEDPISFGGLKLAFAETRHLARNFAIRIDDGKRCVGISGDGEATPASIALFKECDTLIHECFLMDETKWGHASGKQILLAVSNYKKLKTLGLIHIERHERRGRLADLLKLGEGMSFKVRVPNSGDIWE